MPRQWQESILSIQMNTMNYERNIYIHSFAIEVSNSVDNSVAFSFPPEHHGPYLKKKVKKYKQNNSFTHMTLGVTFSSFTSKPSSPTTATCRVPLIPNPIAPVLALFTTSLIGIRELSADL